MTASVTPINEPRSMLAYAKRYLALGWWVLPLTPNTKHPFGRLVPNGVHGATNDLEVATRWWTAEPLAGIGVAMIKSGLVAVDVDPRNGGYESIERLESQHGPIVSDVLQFSGGGGEHRVFSAQLVANLPGKLGPGVDLKADGYICVEPSIHPSGKAYCWEASSDPLEGCIPSTLPGWVRDLSRNTVGEAATIPARRFVDPKTVSDLHSALLAIPADDYQMWVNFGNALSEMGQAGFQLWDEWSQKSAKYDAQGITRKWRSFKPGPYQNESIFFEAQRLGWVNPGSIPAMPEPVPIHEVRVAAAPSLPQAPANLLSPPGILGLVTDWVNLTSRKPQPMFAVQTAIAFAATVLGRRFVTEHRNWPSLYLLNIGQSASGKEYAKKAVESLLESCNMGHLVGPSSYTSSSGVLSALHHQPSHISVIDEFGTVLERAAMANNERAKGTRQTLMEVWGRCDGVVRPQGYSTFGLSAKDAQAFNERSIRNPAITLLAMTTPESFFENVGSAALADGFINRFIIAESNIGPQVSQFRPAVSVPDDVRAWASYVHEISSTLVDASSVASASLIPTPVIVNFTRSAVELFTNFEAQCIERMKDLSAKGMETVVGRCNEIAMKLALVVAAGCVKPGDELEIDGPHMAWAINYVTFHSERSIESFEFKISDSDFSATKNQVLGLINKHTHDGVGGCTVRDLYSRSSKFKKLPKRLQLEVLDSLKFAGLIEFVQMSGQRGKKRECYVAVEQIADGADKSQIGVICD